MRCKKTKLLLSCSLLLSQVSVPVFTEVVHAQETAIVAPASPKDSKQMIAELIVQKERLKNIQAGVLGGPYKDLINVGFTAIESVISDATDLAKGEGIDPTTIYNLNSIGARLNAIVEVIEAIDFSVNYLDDKVIDAHHIMGIKTTHLVYTLLNPLASNSRITQRIEELKAAQAAALNLPDLQGDDIATVYSKAKLDRMIWQTRFKRDQEILGKLPADVYQALNKAITKAVGIQLDPKSTVDEIKFAVIELDEQLNKALKGEVVTVEKRERGYRGNLADITQREETLKHLEEAFKGADYEDIIKRTIQLAEKIKKEAIVAEEKTPGNVPLKVETIGSRMEALVTLIDGIVFATTEATNKVSEAHKQMGYKITKAIIALSDPYASQSTIDKNVQNIIQLKEDIAKYPDLAKDSIATIYVKAKLDNAIWNTRFIRDREILGKSSFDVYNHLNQSITKAVGIQLNPNSTVEDIEQAVAELQAQLSTALGRPVDSLVTNNQNLPTIVKNIEKLPVSAQDKVLVENISRRIHSEQYDAVLKDAFKLMDKLEGYIGENIEEKPLYALDTIDTRMEAVKSIIESIDFATTELRTKDLAIHKDYGFNITRMLIAVSDPHTSAEKIQRRMKELVALKDKAVNAPDIQLDSRANPYVRQDLSKTIWEVRSQRDKTVLGKQSFEVYNELNKAITKAVGVQLNPNSSIRDIYIAIDEVKAALAKAQNGGQAVVEEVESETTEVALETTTEPNTEVPTEEISTESTTEEVETSVEATTEVTTEETTETTPASEIETTTEVTTEEATETTPASEVETTTEVTTEEVVETTPATEVETTTDASAETSAEAVVTELEVTTEASTTPVVE